jgi:alpha-tubulin suppressor-like RCC1 family protein
LYLTSTLQGFGRSGDELRPTVVEEVPFSEEVACGGYHTCVVTDSGDLYSWGSNENGCLGLGYLFSTLSRNLLLQLLLLQLYQCLSKLRMFAYIKFLTSGTDMVRSPEVLKSSLFKFPVSKVSCGWKHTAVISGGDIYTWGWGGANGTFFEEGHSSGGQLGHGNDVDYFEPMMVEFGKNARAVHVSCGFNHTGAIFEYSEN